MACNAIVCYGVLCRAVLCFYAATLLRYGAMVWSILYTAPHTMLCCYVVIYHTVLCYFFRLSQTTHRITARHARQTTTQHVTSRHVTTQHITQHTHVTRHTSHVTRNKSHIHVTRPRHVTSHVTRHTNLNNAQSIEKTSYIRDWRCWFNLHLSDP